MKRITLGTFVLVIGLILFHQIALSATPASKTGRTTLKCDSISDFVDLVTLISLEKNYTQSAGFIEGKYKLSSRLSELKQKYDIGQCGVFLPPQTIFGIWDDRVNMKPTKKEQWLSIPIISTKVEFPKFEFRMGELGIRLGETYQTEATEIRIDGRTYQFIGGKWNITVQSAPQKEDGKAKSPTK